LIERHNLLLAVRDHGVVVFGRAELEVLGRILDLAAELLRELELRFDVGALAQRGLCFGLVVPEARGERLLGQLGEQSLKLGDVKDAPLAPHSAA
jgi:hypothetical protein